MKTVQGRISELRSSLETFHDKFTPKDDSVCPKSKHLVKVAEVISMCKTREKQAISSFNQSLSPKK